MVLVLIRLLFVYVGSFTLKTFFSFFFFLFFFFSLSFLPECRYIRSYSYTYLYPIVVSKQKIKLDFRM